MAQSMLAHSFDLLPSPLLVSVRVRVRVRVRVLVRVRLSASLCGTATRLLAAWSVLPIRSFSL